MLSTKSLVMIKNAICVLAILFILQVQNVSAQSATIYYLGVSVDSELTQYFKVKSKDGDVVYGESVTFPTQLIDSLKNQSSLLIANFLEMPTNVCELDTTKSVSFSPGLDYLQDLPFYTFKKALQVCEQSERYVFIHARIYDGGGAIIINNGKSKYKPRLDILVKVFDKDKNLIWKNKVGVKDFKNLRDVIKRYSNNVDLVRSETLTPYDIYSIYLIGLDLVLK